MFIINLIIIFQNLKNKLEICGNRLNNIKPLNEDVLQFLNFESHPAFTILHEDIKSFDQKYDT